jgi:hypothetical protein
MRPPVLSDLNHCPHLLHPCRPLNWQSLFIEELALPAFAIRQIVAHDLLYHGELSALVPVDGARCENRVPPRNGRASKKEDRPMGMKMQPTYQARKISKSQADALRRRSDLKQVVLLDCFSGFIVVAPEGSIAIDGEILTPVVADYELRPAWISSPLSKLAQARRLLGLEPDPVGGILVGAN